MNKTKLFFLGFAMMLISVLAEIAIITFLTGDYLLLATIFAMAGTAVGGVYMGAASPQQILNNFGIKS